MALFLRHLIRLVHPDGAILDVTDRVSLDDLGTMTEAMEETLLELTHDDMDLTIHDDEGEVRDFLSGAKPSDRYELLLDREDENGEWERIFGGVLDLPWSVQYDIKEKTVSLQVFGFSKVMENTQSSAIARVLGARTGSVAASARLVTVVPDTSQLFSGDSIRLYDGATSETQVINRVLNSDELETVDVWSNAFASAQFFLDTPFPRWLTPSALAGQLFDAAGIEKGSIEIGKTFNLASYPIATPINANGLTKTNGRVKSITEKTGQIVVSYSSAPARYKTGVGGGPTSGFTIEDSGSNFYGDWRPYLTSEPATIRQGTSGQNDLGGYAWDHQNAHTFELRIVAGAPLAPWELHLFRDGASIKLLDTTGVTGAAAPAFLFFLDYSVDLNSVYFSYVRRLTGEEFLKKYDITADTITTLRSGAGSYGQLRMSRNPVRLAHLSGTTLDFYGILVSPDTVVLSITGVPAKTRLWTLRSLVGTEDKIVFLYESSTAGCRLRMYQAGFTTVAADYEVSPTIDADTFLTVWDDPNEPGDDVLGIGYAGGSFFVLARYFAGVIPYSDIGEGSCAAVLRDIALISLCMLKADRFKVGSIQRRLPIAASSGGASPELPTPIERESAHLWQSYRTSAVVSGKSESGESISVTVGSDSARRLELSSDLITTGSLAQLIGEVAVALFSTLRGEERVTVPEEGIIRPLEKRSLDGKEYLVSEAQTDLAEREQELILVELEP